MSRIIDAVELDTHSLQSFWFRLRNPKPEHEPTTEFPGRMTFSLGVVELSELEVGSIGRRYPPVLFGTTLYHGLQLRRETSPHQWEVSVDHIEDILIGDI